MITQTNTPHLIEIIERFPLTTSFVEWLSCGDYEFSVLEEQKTQEKYSRTVQFGAEGLVIQIAKIELWIEPIGQDFIERFLKAGYPFGKYAAQHPEAQITKIYTSKELTDTQYILASEIRKKGIVCGACWEAYELDHVQYLLNMRKST